jgi:Ca2+-binding EF-hand superfamily protein
VRRLFAVFDRDNNGVVDFAELVAGLSVLCGGSRDDKIVHAFRVIDVDGDGRISIDEMIAYLTGVFKLVFESSGANAVATSPEELAEATALQCFEEADTDRDGFLSFEEYRDWYSSGADADVQRGPGGLCVATLLMMLFPLCAWCYLCTVLTG